MRSNRLILALAIWSVFGLVCLISKYAHAGKLSVDERSQDGLSITNNRSQNTTRPIPPGLQRIMAGGAGRVVNPTCDDVRAVVAWLGEAKAVEMARGAGATDSQIREARRCLKSSSR
jgi:hypothetical protein